MSNRISGAGSPASVQHAPEGNVGGTSHAKSLTPTQNTSDYARFLDRYSASGFDPSPRHGTGVTRHEHTVRQDTATDCGAAAVATLVRGAGKEKRKTDGQVMDALDKKFGGGKAGTTPDQIKDMLAHEGFEVERGASNFDQVALDAALARGDKALALVDSKKVRPGDSQAQGAPHWVVVSGSDGKGNYHVQDPADGSSYDVGLNDLANAVNSGWNSYGGGGMLMVHDGGHASAGAIEQESAKHAGALGDTGGIGSNAKSFNIEG